MKATLIVAFVCLPLFACSTPLDALSDFEPVNSTTVLPAPEPLASSAYDAASVAQGKYMVELLGCGACHTDGALIGAPDASRLLAGSSIGLAHSNPLNVDYPAESALAGNGHRYGD